eukprot:scaffold276679_cov22-Prasinocladus_malaysianus.AAC.1
MFCVFRILVHQNDATVPYRRTSPIISAQAAEQFLALSVLYEYSYKYPVPVSCFYGFVRLEPPFRYRTRTEQYDTVPYRRWLALVPVPVFIRKLVQETSTRTGGVKIASMMSTIITLVFKYTRIHTRMSLLILSRAESCNVWDMNTVC